MAEDYHGYEYYVDDDGQVKRRKVRQEKKKSAQPRQKPPSDMAPNPSTLGSGAAAKAGEKIKSRKSSMKDYLRRLFSE